MRIELNNSHTIHCNTTTLQHLTIWIIAITLRTELNYNSTIRSNTKSVVQYQYILRTELKSSRNIHCNTKPSSESFLSFRRHKFKELESRSSRSMSRTKLCILTYQVTMKQKYNLETELNLQPMWRISEILMEGHFNSEAGLIVLGKQTH